MAVTLDVDFNNLRIALVREIAKVTGLANDHVILNEPEVPEITPRPTKPYMAFKFITPAMRLGGSDSHDLISKPGDDAAIYNSGGQRKIVVSFNAYGRTHEEAYNLMSLWQTALDLEDIQADLYAAALSVMIIGNVADLSQLLNTGFEGRAQMDVDFGVAMNVSSDLGYIRSVEIDGDINVG